MDATSLQIFCITLRIQMNEEKAQNFLSSPSIVKLSTATEFKFGLYDIRIGSCVLILEANTSISGSKYSFYTTALTSVLLSIHSILNSCFLGSWSPSILRICE